MYVCIWEPKSKIVHFRYATNKRPLVREDETDDLETGPVRPRNIFMSTTTADPTNLPPLTIPIQRTPQMQ